MAEDPRQVNRNRRRSVVMWAGAIVLVCVFVGVWQVFGKRPDLRDSVVRVETEHGHGTGFLIDAERAIFATNKHVVVDEHLGKVYEIVKVVFRDNGSFPDKNSFYATIIDVSIDKDLALLQAINAPAAQDLPFPLSIASSSVAEGQTVTVIGHPANEDFRVMHPRVSKVDEDVIYLDGSDIDRGCSGAPVRRLAAVNLPAIVM